MSRRRDAACDLAEILVMMSQGSFVFFKKSFGGLLSNSVTLSSKYMSLSLFHPQASDVSVDKRKLSRHVWPAV